MQYSIINYSHSAVYYTFRTPLFYNWKFVHFYPIHPFLLPCPPCSHLWKTISLFSVSLSLFFKNPSFMSSIFFFNNLTSKTETNILSESEIAQSCPTLCDPMDCSPPGSSIHAILQARILEWAAISFSNAWKWKVKVKVLSRVRLFATPWTAAHQAPPSMRFSKQEYWSGVPLPSPKEATEPLKYRQS